MKVRIKRNVKRNFFGEYGHPQDTDVEGTGL